MQLNGAASGLNLIADYGYDAQSRRTSLVRGNGAATSYAYTPAARLSNLTHDLEGAGTAHDANWAFGYNVAGQMVQRSLVAVYERTVPALSESYARNGLNQYTNVAGSAFTHDARGNLTSDGAPLCQGSCRPPSVREVVASRDVESVF